MSLTRAEMKELRESIALECLIEIMNCTPELDDKRLGYVSLQVNRELWLSARHCPSPPYLDAIDILPKDKS
jgi:hypothetical protein